MDFAASAAKHGISWDDVLHAIRTAMAQFDQQVLLLDRPEVAMTETKPGTHADSDIDAWLDNIDPSKIVLLDAPRVRAIGQALYAIEAAEAQLEDAVADAKAAGVSWSTIAMVLNTSKQAAHRKFGPKPGAKAN